jgi:hypothetical protein
MLPALGHRSTHRDCVAGLECVLGPASARKFGRSGKFALPLLGFTFVVLHVKVDLAMRIHELEIGDRSLYCDRVFHVVGRRPVMRERWTCPFQKVRSY